MKLKELFSIFGKVEWRQTTPEHEALGVFSDSRKITGGTVFVATAGVNSDGHDFILNAIDQGALALVVESLDQVPEDYTGAVLQVLDSKIAYAELLREFFARPEEKLIAIAVTGTNGKTSSCYIVEAIFNEADVPCGVMGTIDHHFKEKKWKSELTTPDTASLFQRLKDFCELGAKAYVMEVSSHSLKQQRVPLTFDIAIFTNFTRDHLDYHKTMDDYWRSKQLLFNEHIKEQDDTFAIINNDDPQVKLTKVPSSVTRLTIGKKDSDFTFAVKNFSLKGMEFTVQEAGKGAVDYRTSMVGEHNIYNLLGGIAAGRAWGIPHATCQRAIEKFAGIPGRLERVADQHGRHIFVDYAHTPDALEKVLKNLVALKGQEDISLITVFGCGGDRDRGKRPLMGQVAETYSNQVIITSDNPRHEDPELIIDEIVAGMKSKNHQRLSDRRSAIEKALQLAKPGDVVLVAGKGHEDYQLIGERSLSFSDVLTIKNILQAEQT